MNDCIKIKPETCIACRRCEVACIASHHGMTFKEAMKQRGKYRARVQVFKTDALKSSVRCHQCQFAPCCSVCPTGALRQLESGKIEFHDELCIACEMCVRACPYGAVQLGAPDHCNFQEEADNNTEAPLDPPHCRVVALRCDLCREWRAEKDLRITACMEACPVQALYMLKSDGTLLEAPKPQKKAVAKKTDSGAGTPPSAG